MPLCSRILLCIALLSPVFIFSQSNNPGLYCVGVVNQVSCTQPGPSNAAGNSENDFINTFSTAGAVCNIINPNSGCNGLPLNYINYGNTNILEVTAGQVITCTLQSGIDYDQGFAIFIDWNQNTVFDPLEQVAATNMAMPSGVSFTLSFTVPAAQAGGVYRLRVRCTYMTAGTAIDACALYEHGETEDYTVIVKGPGGVTCTQGSPLPTCNAVTNSPAESFATTYTATACGLNYVRASAVLNKRSGNGMVAGVNQPTTVTIAGIPTCGRIYRAFLYTSCETYSTAPTINASVTNPAGTNSTFSMALVGTGSSKCWCRTNSFSYRADVTSIVTGNGNYSLSGFPVFPGNSDVNGVTLFVIYTDETQNYTGSIVIGHGMSTYVGNAGVQRTISGFNVCATPSLTSNFMIVDDLQGLGNANIALNSATANYVQPALGQQPWMMISQPGAPAVAGQTSATFGISNTSDCFGMVMAGMYYRTNCLTCPNPMTLTATGSSCTPTNSASVLAINGVAPFTYTWSGTAQTTSLVTNLQTGVHTVTVADAFACKVRTATVTVAASTSIVVNNGTLCPGYTTTLSVITPMNSYTWSPAATILGSVNSSTVLVNPTTTSIYTVSGTNSVNCVSSNTLQLNIVPTQTIPVLSPTACVGAALQLTANATYTGSTYQWTGPGGYTSMTQNPIRNPATLAMGGPYTIVVVSAQGCTSSAVANATIFMSPVSPSITSNAPICSGSQLNLGGTGGTTYFWQGPNTFTSNLQNVAITNATNTLHSGIYTLTANFPTGCSSIVTGSITVRALPIPTITSNSPVCLGKVLNLSGAGGVSYVWSGPNGFTSGIQNPNVPAVSFASAGLYSVTTTDAFGCQGGTTHSVTVTGNPTITAVSGSTVCYGYQGPLTVISTGGGAYSWTGPGGSFAVQNPTVASVVNASAGVYTVTVGNALSTCTAQATATLATMPSPVITTTGTSVCSGQPAALFSNGAQTYTWSGPSAYSSNLQNPIINPVTNLNVTTYTVVGSGPNSCTASATATLQARANPTVVATGTNVCYGSQATLFASGATTYTWSGPNTYTSLAQNPYFPSVTNLSAGIYTVVVTAANNCTAMGTTLLSTKANPTVTAIGSTVCLNQATSLSAGPASGVSFVWTGPTGPPVSGATLNIVSAGSAATQVYTVTGTAVNSCTHQVTTSLNTLPLPVLTTTGSLICLNQPYTLSASGATSYIWSGPSIPASVNSQTVLIPMVNASSAGNYVVIGTAANTCTNTATANVGTLSLPTINATSTTVCLGQPAVLIATGGIASGYSWIGPDNYTYAQANAFVPLANNTTTGVYTVVGTSASSCTNFATATLSYNTLPFPGFTAPTRVCVRGSIMLQAWGGTTYTWTGPNNYLYAAPQVTIPVYNNMQGGTYTLSVQNAEGCLSDTTVDISINPLPGGALLSDNLNKNCVPYCANYSLRANNDGSPITSISWLIGNKTYTGTTFNHCVTQAGVTSVIGNYTNSLGCVNKVAYEVKSYPNPIADFEYLPFSPIESVDEVKFTNTSQGEEINKWEWNFINNDGYQTGEKNPAYLFEDAGTYVVAMVVTNDWGCMDTVVKKVIVDVDFKLYIPNAFTPNGDGLNDVFQPKGRGIEKYHLSIYDRWGAVIYQTDDFMKGWDGSEKGTQLTDDIYAWRIYMVDVHGKVKELTGFVMITR